MADKRVIFESEEEFDDFYANCGRNSVGDYDYKVMKEKVIAKGYIRKNPVEEAEEMYHDKIKERNNFEYASKYSISQIVDKQNEAIQYLQNQIVELNKKVGEI